MKLIYIFNNLSNKLKIDFGELILQKNILI